jgi:replicative DNA helicase
MIDLYDRERVDAEQSVIGSMIIDQRCIPDVAAILNQDDFIAEVNQLIFETALDKSENGMLFDPVVAIDAARTKLGDKAGDYIVELVALTPTANNAVEYAKIVKKHSRLRFIRNGVSGLLTGDDPQEIAGSIIGLCQECLQDAQGNEAYTLREALLKLYEEKRKKTKGLMTGISKLDRRIKGMCGGDLVVIGARPGTGKSVLAGDISLYNARNGAKTILFSLEMSREAIAERYVSQRGDLDMDTLIDAEFTPGQWTEFTSICETLSKIPLTIMDSSGMNVPRIRAIARSIPDVKLIVIDYLQLMTAVGRHDNETHAIGSISKGLKILARELHVPIVVLSQLSRKSDEYQKPKLEHLRDSGQIEQDADTVVVLWKTEEVPDGAPQPVGRAVIKARRGRLGTDITMFDGAHMKFTETEDRYEAPKKTTMAFE